MRDSLTPVSTTSQAIVGGAKISDKILVIENLIDKCDRVMCIGGMARRAIPAQFCAQLWSQFLTAHQHLYSAVPQDQRRLAIGKSLFDKNGAELVPKPAEKAGEGCEMVFLIDWLCGQEFRTTSRRR